MSVSFSDGPHPSHDPSSTRSTRSVQASGKGKARPSFRIPSNTSSPDTPTFPTIPRPDHPPEPDGPEDPERQPLISSRDLSRTRIVYPLIVAVILVLVLGAVVLGGWRLGKGEGGGRWPGGPH